MGMVVGGRSWVLRLTLGAAVVSAGCYGATRHDDESTAGGGAGDSGSGHDAGGAGPDGYPEGYGGDGTGAGLNWPEPPGTAPPAVDLLFVIDNSISMADKQELLRDAVPELVRRLITPNCVDASGAVVGVADALGTCASGDPEFGAVTNLHLGIITSSLGGHGGQVCYDAAYNDRARMLGSVRAGLPSWDGTGFLAWDPTGAGSSPPGESDADVLIGDFQDHVTQVGEVGCGYEAPLEAFYRFLIDPDPPEEIVQLNGMSQPQGTDSTILAQRAAFLRPDSLVGVLVVSDENDCSILDEGQGWLVGLQQNGGQPFQMPRSTSACATDPDSECCRSCATNESLGTPDGCLPISDDPECALGNLSSLEDNLNLRCWDQKRRFGFDLLYPVERYVRGLSSLVVPNRAGVPVPNPLFVNGDVVRHHSRAFMAGAVGVPWQDLSDSASWADEGLRYLTPAELESEGRWQIMLGNPDSYEPPSDPLMIESPDPRGGTHPLLGVPVAPPSSTNPRENPINGHEQNVTKRDDLQYACIFPLTTPRDCSLQGTDANACDCNSEDLERNRPLCQPPEGGPPGTTQYFAKAYPGIRHLQVLRGLQQRAIVTSVCPKLVDGDLASPSYGYNPLSVAVVTHAAPILRGELLSE